ncbi:MAG: phosphoadenylyl-sulfate reductase [Chitinophagaceae bacterium]|nr:phosphoadenylyl-sulfate reductase [Bacteroidota bacterium]MCC6257103.1 phosphoadenylyl-sulfate reductase [Chitinophagaceae bacterium]MCW5916383.1 phosphoadenylyl-sulfate reductase [Ferruginibacter sp.]
MKELLHTLQIQLAGKAIEEQFSCLLDYFPGRISFSTSFGQEDQVLTDIICRHRLAVRIFTIDTGRLFYETYELIDKTRARYNTKIEVYFPDHQSVERMVTKKGLFSFYESVENRIECCQIRKVEPLGRALIGVSVWVTGLRAQQSANRHDMPLLQWDEEKNLFKFNPLLHWRYEDVIDYIRKNDVPDNPLHRKGFISIGCAPCTRAIEPGEDPRAGRWWWETSKKECGLHK